MKHPEIISKMSLEQKASFVSGFDYWHLEEAPELGLPKIMVTDGPHGLRKQNTDKKTSNGIGLGTRFPQHVFLPLQHLLAPGTPICLRKQARQWALNA